MTNEFQKAAIKRAVNTKEKQEEAARKKKERARKKREREDKKIKEASAKEACELKVTLSTFTT